MNDALDVVTAADQTLLPGVAGLVQSVHANAQGARIRFHLLTREADERAARSLLQCFATARPETMKVSIHAISEAWINATLLPRIRVEADPAITGKLSSPLNYVRFFLTALLPASVVGSVGKGRVLYLDADIIVRGNLYELVSRVSLPAGIAVAAVPRHEAHFRYKRYEQKCASVYELRYPDRPPFDPSLETFNAGVILLDLQTWQRLQLTEEALWWMDQHRANADGGLWHLGSQPILHLMLHGRWHPLPDHWNLDGLGRVAQLPAAALKAAHLLHWTGRRKPWLPDGLHSDLYRLYVPTALLRRCWPAWTRANARPISFSTHGHRRITLTRSSAA